MHACHEFVPLKQMSSADYIVTYFIEKAYVHLYPEFVPLKQMPSADRVVTHFIKKAKMLAYPEFVIFETNVIG